MTDRQTDRRTDRQTEFSSLYRVCITCSAVKTCGNKQINRYMDKQTYIQTDKMQTNCRSTYEVIEQVHMPTNKQTA